MCQACFDKGFNDYPRFETGGVAHIEDYKRGYKTRQNETYDAGELEHTFFCELCYKRGLNNSKIGLWAPPVSTKRGHYESYEKGYNQVEVDEKSRVPEYHQPGDQRAAPPVDKGNIRLIVVGVIGLIIIGFVVFIAIKLAFRRQGSSPQPAASQPTIVADTAARATLAGAADTGKTLASHRINFINKYNTALA